MPHPAMPLEIEWQCPVCQADNTTAYEPEDRRTVENFGIEAECETCGTLALVTSTGNATELHT